MTKKGKKCIASKGEKLKVKSDCSRYGKSSSQCKKSKQRIKKIMGCK